MGPYATVSSQRGMNFDAVRNPCYERAIRQCVTADSLVLDLGAGLGMLGFLAARAGARKVYLVEPQPVIEVTRLVAEANGFENVECIQLSAEDLELRFEEIRGTSKLLKKMATGPWDSDFVMASPGQKISMADFGLK